MSSPPPQEFGRQEEEKEEKGLEEEQDPEARGEDPQPGGDLHPGVIHRQGKRRRLAAQKVDQSKIVDIQSLPANPLLEAPFLKQTALQVKVFVGNKVYVANTGDADVSIPVGTFLCGYGRGKFDRNTKGNFNPDCHLMFKIKTCDDFVFTSKMVTVKEVVAEQRAKNPEAKIAYHSMFDIASTDKDAFGVKQEHEVFFIPAFTSGEEGGQSQSITQSTLAGKLPANTFENSHCVVATWSVKWSPQGLGPVRPLVLFNKSCDLPAGKALSLM
mgnify:CR=1 FL=1